MRFKNIKTLLYQFESSGLGADEIMLLPEINVSQSTELLETSSIDEPAKDEIVVNTSTNVEASAKEKLVMIKEPIPMSEKRKKKLMKRKRKNMSF